MKRHNPQANRMFTSNTIRRSRLKSRKTKLEALEPRVVLDASLIISELMASNDTVLLDEDGESSDWLEISNPSAYTVELEGWYLTDNIDRPTKWEFPESSLEPGEAIVVFASGKDRDRSETNLHTNFKLSGSGEYLALVAPDGFTVVDQYSPYPEQYTDISYGPEQSTEDRTLISTDAPARIYLPTSAANDIPTATWTDIGFNDSQWTSASGGVGYDTNSVDGDFNSLIAADSRLDSMRDTTASAYYRSTFQIDGTVPAFTSLGLELNYDDGFVAYLNGTEVARNLAPASLGWNSTATGERGGETSAIVYSDFSDEDDRDTFTLLGNATWEGDRLRLTTNDLLQTGAAWVTEPMVLGPDYSFTATMRINAHSPNGIIDNDGRGGDGMTFVLQSGGNNRLGGGGGQLGLDGSGMTFIAVEFDTFNSGSFDPDESLGTHVGINTSVDGNVARAAVPRFNGSPAELNVPGPGVDDRFVWVDYIGGLNLLNVYFSETESKPAEPTVTAEVDLEQLFGGVKELWTGFTGATGIGTNQHDVQSFSFTAGDGELGLQPSVINISSAANQIRSGENVLAIHGLNIDASDDDFLIRPQLVSTVNGIGDPKYFGTPTPGETNGTGSETPPTGEVSYSSTTRTFVSSFDLELTAPSPDAVIRYTTNGSIPTASSTRYTSPIRISSSTRIRARAFEPGLSDGPVRSESFVRISSSLSSFEDGKPFESNLPIMIFESYGKNVDGQDRLMQPVTGIFINPGEDGVATILDEPEFGGRAGMRIRGQTSQGFAKKQYAVELWDETSQDTRAIDASQAADQAAGFFGLPEESDWVLNGPYSDKTQLNNYLTFLWSNKAGLYAPRARLVEVFLNQGGGSVSSGSDYRGTYVLLEKIKLDDNRVDLERLTPQDREEPAITGGYIWKKDKAGAGDQPFSTSRGQELRMVEPDDREITNTQKNWLRSHLNEFEAALYGPDFTDPETGYAAYIDVASWVDTWLLVEMTKNIDGFRLSTYYHKDRGGKIQQGPAWDYNLSLGNGNYLRGAYPDGWYHDGISSSQYPYWDRLFDDPNFEQQVIDRWNELRSSIWSTESLIADIDTAVDALSNGNPRLDRPLSSQPSNPISRNFDRWNNIASYQWPNCFFGQGSCPPSPLPGGGRPNDYGDYIYIMKDFVERRTAWIDTQFPTGPTISPAGGSFDESVTVSLDVPNGSEGFYTIDGSDPRQTTTVGAESKLLTAGSTAHVLVPTNNNLINECDELLLDTPERCFMSPSYELGTLGESWTTGRMGVGYDENTNYRPFIRTDVEDEMNNDNTSVYLRIPFNVTEEQAEANSVRLKMRYDDGFVAYLWQSSLKTPVEVARANAPGTARKFPINPLDYNEQATGTHDDNAAVVFSDFDISSSAAYIREGENFLIIQGLNRGLSSSDFLIDAEIVAATTSVDLPNNVLPYESPFTLTDNTQVTARLYRPGEGTWSAPSSEIFIAEAPRLAITEINYNPGDPTTAELASIPDLNNDDFEFIEIRNVGAEPAALIGSSFTSGIEYVFPSTTLAAGEQGVLVKNEAAFRLRYEDNARVLGEFADGSLNNGGERIVLNDVSGNPILDFEYADNALWPQTADGRGATLQLVNELSTPADAQGKYYSWRGSTEYGGSPGAEGAAPIGIIINEVLSHTDPPITEPDSIELYNTTTNTIDLSGWYLSDAAGNFLKYQIPAGTQLAPNSYRVFNEADFNPNPLNQGPNDFSLSGANGDDVWLTIADTNGQVTQFVNDVHFWATPNGESLGRFPNGTGLLTRMSTTTLGQTNSEPRVGPIVISEVHHTPAEPSFNALILDPSMTSQQLEFVEISNTTGTFLDLTNWRIRGGIDFEFTPSTTLAPQQSILIVSWDPKSEDNANRLAAFRAHHQINNNVPIVGGYRGRLSDFGERVALQRPDDPPMDSPNTIPHMLEDEVIYDNRAPWPGDTAGTGKSLQRSTTLGYGNFSASWLSANANPGEFDGEVVVRGDFSGDGVVDVQDINLLCTAINGGGDLSFDLTGDGTVNHKDHFELIEVVLNTSYGDANLDGIFDSTDLIQVFQAGVYEISVANNATWTEGDWNCDSEFNSSDLILAFQRGNYAPAIAGATQMPIRPAAADVIHQDRETPLLDEALTPSFEIESVDARPTDLTLTAVETTADERDRALNQLSEEDWKELEI